MANKNRWQIQSCKVLKKFQHRNFLSEKRINFVDLNVYYKNHPCVRGLKFHMNYIYKIPAKYVNSYDNNRYAYSSLLGHEYNLHRSYAKYRAKTGLLQPQFIKQARKQLKLSQGEVGAILGISVSALSKIENNNLVQSLSQDTRLRCLTNGIMLASLIKAHLPFIKLEQPPHVRISDLKKAVQKIDNLN